MDGVFREMPNFATRLNLSREELLITLKEVNKTDDPLKSIAEKLLGVLDGRKVAELRSVFTIPRSERSEWNEDYRLRNLSLLIDLRERLNPRKCVFQASEEEQEELEFLEAEDIEWRSVHDLAQEKPMEGEVDIFYVSNAHLVLANDLLAHRWKELGTTQLFLLMSMPMRCIRNTELYALGAFDRESENELLFSTKYGKTQRVVRVRNFKDQQSVPVMEDKKGYKLTLLPFYEDSSKHPNRPVQMTELCHIDGNVRKIQEHLAEIGFIDECVENVTTLLEGRTIKRIRLVGIGHFAHNVECASALLHCVYQLSLALYLRDHFKVPEMTSQEPRSTPFEKEYLESAGVKVLNATNMRKVEEDLEHNETTLFLMFYSYHTLYNNIFWANRKQIRKILMVGNDRLIYGHCTSDCEKEVELAKRIPKQFGALDSFFKRCASKLLITPPSGDYYLRLAFRMTGIMSYPEDTLDDVGDEEPVYTNDVFVDVPQCSCDNWEKVKHLYT